MPPFETSLAPLPTDASVWKLTISTPIDAAMLGPLFDEVPPAAAMPTRQRSPLRRRGILPVLWILHLIGR